MQDLLSCSGSEKTTENRTQESEYSSDPACPHLDALSLIMKEGEILGVHGCEGEFGVGLQGRPLLHGGGVPLCSIYVCVGFSGRVPFSTIFISLKTNNKTPK